MEAFFSLFSLENEMGEDGEGRERSDRTAQKNVLVLVRPFADAAEEGEKCFFFSSEGVTEIRGRPPPQRASEVAPLGMSVLPSPNAISLKRFQWSKPAASSAISAFFSPSSSCDRMR